MRLHTLLISTVALGCIVAGGGITGLWWLQTDTLEKQIAQLNQSDSPVSLSHQAIEKTGFPLEPGIRIQAPQLTVNIPSLLSFTNRYEAISISKPLLEQNYSITAEGNQNASIKIKSQEWLLNSSYQGAVTIAVSMATPWDFLLQPEASDARQWLQHVRNVTIQTPAGEGTDASGKPLYRHEPTQLTFNYKPTSSDIFATDIRMTNTGITFTPEYDALMQQIVTTFGGAAAHGFTSTMAHSGKISADFGFAYEGPSPEAFITSPSKPSFKVSLNPGHYKSDLADTNSSIHINYQLQAAELKKQTEFDISHTVAFTPKFDQIVAYSTMELLRNPEMASIFPQVAQLDQNTLWPLAASLIPRTSSLGNIHYRLKGTYSADGATKQVSLGVENLDLTTTPYGITAHGNVSTSMQSQSNQSDFTATCRACSTLLDDLTNYLQRAQLILQQLSPSDGTDEQMKALLHGEPWYAKVVNAKAVLEPLANSAGSPDWQYHLVRKDAGQITVNNQPLPAILGMMMDGMMLSTLPTNVSESQALSPIK